MPLCPLCMAVCPAYPARLYSSYPSYQSWALLEGLMLETTRMPIWLPSSFLSYRHLKEISELQSQQKQEIEALPPPRQAATPNLGLFTRPHPSAAGERPAEQAEGGEVVSPLVQQLKVVASSTGWPRAL